MWQHNYAPLSGSLGGSAVVAAIPIVVLFLMLGVFRKPAWMSAVSALISAFVIALAVYGMRFEIVEARYDAKGKRELVPTGQPDVMSIVNVSDCSSSRIAFSRRGSSLFASTKFTHQTMPSRSYSSGCSVTK